MRTTLTLEDDVAERVHAEMRRTGSSFKEVVNALLRRGLGARKAAKLAPFVVRERPLGLRPGLGYDDVEELLDHAEGPRRR